MIFPRAHWPLERALEVFSGQDRNVRVVKIQTCQNTFMRPVSKFVLLESTYDERRRKEFDRVKSGGMYGRHCKRSFQNIRNTLFTIPNEDK